MEVLSFWYILRSGNTIQADRERSLQVCYPLRETNTGVDDIHAHIVSFVYPFIVTHLNQKQS